MTSLHLNCWIRASVMLFRCLWCYTAYSVPASFTAIFTHVDIRNRLQGRFTHKYNTHTPGWQCRIQKKEEWFAFKPVWKTRYTWYIWVCQMTSRADVSLQSWPGAFEVFTSPSISITNIPSVFLLFPDFTFLSGLHSGCITVPAMWMQNKDLSSPVRVALMHTIARHRQSDSPVLLGCSAPVSSLTHTAAAPQDSEPEPPSRLFMTRTAVTRH